MPKVPHIAVVIDLSWPYKRHFEVFAGIRNFAQNCTNWTFDLGNFPHYELSLGKHYDGIVGRIGKDCLMAAQAARIPVVNTWIDSPMADKMPGVQFDSRAAGRLAAEHLIARGFTRLAHFGFQRSADSKMQYEGMAEVAAEYGYPCSWHSTHTSFCDKPDNWSRFVMNVKEALTKWEAPQGVAVPYDELANAVAAISRSEGWQIPEELALVGCGNELPICNAVDPTLSSIERGDWKCGFEAARMLNDLMKGGKRRRARMLIPPMALVVRKSSDIHAVSDPRVARALSHMLLNLNRRLAVQDIAHFVGVGRQTLERAFQIHLGRTINDELIRMRISKLKRLLVQSEDSIKEISYKAGFGTTANMFPMFKRHTGMTPKEYRDKYGSPPLS